MAQRTAIVFYRALCFELVLLFVAAHVTQRHYSCGSQRTVISCTFRIQATRRTKANIVRASPQQMVTPPSHTGEPASIVATTAASMLVQGPIAHPSLPREASIQQPQMAGVPGDSYYSFHQAHGGVPAATVTPMHGGGERLAADGIVRVTGVQHRLSDAPGVVKKRIVRCRQ